MPIDFLLTFHLNLGASHFLLCTLSIDPQLCSFVAVDRTSAAVEAAAAADYHYSPREVGMSRPPVWIICVRIWVSIGIPLAALKVVCVVNLFLLAKGIAYLIILCSVSSRA